MLIFNVFTPQSVETVEARNLTEALELAEARFFQTVLATNATWHSRHLKVGPLAGYLQIVNSKGRVTTGCQVRAKLGGFK